MAERKNGLNRCPHCGASDVKFSAKTGKVSCLYCHCEFEARRVNEKGGVRELKGEKVGAGAEDIIPDKKIILTFECPACGGGAVINAEEEYEARCHWCRHVFTLNEVVPNGAVPDMVLPFKLEKAEAQKKIGEFVGNRSFFAHPKFRREFKLENIIGVYFPYMVVDVKAKAKMSGHAEHQTRSYYVKVGKTEHHYYDADLYEVSREFDVLVDDLVIEASKDKIRQDIQSDTKNVINSIMPFDTENCVEWNPGYLRGFQSERRDVDVKALKNAVEVQCGDIARYRIREQMKFYDRGTSWTSEDIDVEGTLWKSAYLPVWVYSFLQNDPNQKMLHYVVVNGRTGETMGSVPINRKRLFGVSFLVEALSLVIGFAWFSAFIDDDIRIALLALVTLAPGFIFYGVKYSKYRNAGARYLHEKEVESSIENIVAEDKKVKSRTRLSSATIANKNDTAVNGVLARNSRGLNIVDGLMKGAEEFGVPVDKHMDAENGEAETDK